MQYNNPNRQSVYPPNRGNNGSGAGTRSPQNMYGTADNNRGRYAASNAGRANSGQNNRPRDRYGASANHQNGYNRNTYSSQSKYNATRGNMQRNAPYQGYGAFQKYGAYQGSQQNLQNDQPYHRNAPYQEYGAYQNRYNGNTYIRQDSEEERLYRARERAAAAEALRRRAAAREMRRRVELQIKQERKMRRKRQRKIFCGRALVCLIVFAVLMLITAAAFAFRFFRSPDIRTSHDVTYTYGGKEVRTVSAEQAFSGNKMYVCFNDVAKYLDYSVTGDSESMKFVLPIITENEDGEEEKTYSAAETGSAGDGSEEYVMFLNDSRTVIINAQQITLPSETVIYGENVWVSADFISEFMDGLSVNYTKKGHKIEVSRILDKEKSTKKEKVYLPVSLKLKSPAPIPAIGGTENGGGSAPITVPNVTFSTDLTAYEQYMNPENSVDYLILINSENTLDAGYVPEDLTNIENTRSDGRTTVQLRLCAAKSLDALFIEMKAAGFTDVSVTSGYRGYDYQSTLFNSYVNREMQNNSALTREEAEAIVVTYSSRPGTSEHQSGLCIDMHNLPEASTEFKDDPAYAWLCENAWKFGFILRYPEAKTDVTSISYEPWHWRFVGRNAAYEISTSSMCLEEYTASKK